MKIWSFPLDCQQFGSFPQHLRKSIFILWKTLSDQFKEETSECLINEHYFFWIKRLSYVKNSILNHHPPHHLISKHVRRVWELLSLNLQFSPYYDLFVLKISSLYLCNLTLSPQDFCLRFRCLLQMKIHCFDWTGRLIKNCQIKLVIPWGLFMWNLQCPQSVY